MTKASYRELDAEEAVQPQAKPSSLDGSVQTEHAGQGAQRQIRREIFDPGAQKAWLRDDQGQEIYLGLQVVFFWSCQENEDRGSSSDFEYGRMERYLFESRVDSHIKANTRWRNLSLERRQKRQKFSAPGTFQVNATADPNQIGLWVNMNGGRELRQRALRMDDSSIQSMNQVFVVGDDLCVQRSVIGAQKAGDIWGRAERERLKERGESQ
ncbi:hypothetical protein C8R45DRAFT_942687 [Mycena sanguinolenta]|nr:hypothetical protein C8R45DRAFT_942687 [Mycena sanguinolenta]